MPALDLMVKLFSESKEEIHRYITKIEVTADTTYEGVVDDIKTKMESTSHSLRPRCFGDQRTS